MSCACGFRHTITLSDDGTAYSFGVNSGGELGLGLHNDVSLPTPIPILPKISQVSCGSYFTVCVDYEGFIWSFGENEWANSEQETTDFNVPQKLEIPPVHSVACGSSYTLIITNDDNLWSWGRNDCGQLFHGDTETRLIPKKHHFRTFQKYQLVIAIHFLNTTKEKYLHVVTTDTEHVGWVILIFLKSHQVSFPICLQILLILFVGLTKVYFLIQSY